jgi:hypothetical protein
MVDVLMSRDSDSRIIPREEAAVREWLASDRIFHIMRDHPYHCIPILGGNSIMVFISTKDYYGIIIDLLIGMWGVKLSVARSTLLMGDFKKIFSTNHSHKYNYDQILLKKYIWPIAKTNMVIKRIAIYRKKQTE